MSVERQKIIFSRIKEADLVCRSSFQILTFVFICIINRDQYDNNKRSQKYYLKNHFLHSSSPYLKVEHWQRTLHPLEHLTQVIFVRRNLKALPTTETEDRLMAAAAMMGDSKIPRKG